MRVLAVAAMALLAGGAQAQNPSRNAPLVLEKLCGKLVHYEQIPVKNMSNTFEDRTRNLPHVSVQLYGADGDRPCCSGLSLLGQRKTGRWGSFHLKEKALTRGLYWIMAQPNSREYRLLIQYEPQRNATQLCSETFFEVDDAGNFWKTETVFVE